MSGYPRKENICFSRTTIARKGSGVTGASASHVQVWCGCGYICVGPFPTYCNYEEGITQGFSLFWMVTKADAPVCDEYIGKGELLQNTVFPPGHGVDGSGSGLVLFLITPRGWLEGRQGKARQSKASCGRGEIKQMESWHFIWLLIECTFHHQRINSLKRPVLSKISIIFSYAVCSHIPDEYIYVWSTNLW